ncbi:MAG TPA: lysylphosphatidylglycerol synthase transmembrane domain-containing protein [Ignavibacteriaceae bacterium]|nr:lysylphosphatidylglycerol synthase transmembrane domain-containing protein [Ignavibacteriaceae bacterium]
MLKKLKKKVLISIVIAGIVYLAFTIYADYEEVLLAFYRFDLILILPLLLLSFLNYITRFFKWDYYISIVGVELKKTDSFSIFMTGLIMSVTPGKIGELLKAYLVKEVTNTSVSKTAPIIFAERVTDFISLLLITVTGAFAFDYGSNIVIIVSLFLVILVIAISNKRLALDVLTLLEKIVFIKKYLTNLHTAFESSYLLLKPKPLLLMTLLSLFSWGFECLGYYIILLNFGIDFGLFWAFFSYSFATIIGAISMLPGGLGITEGSLTFMLIRENISKNVAFATTFIIRVVTLWFAVFVGVLSVIIYQKRFGKLNVDSF